MARSITLFALLPLAACAGSGGSYPSLQPRAAELPREIAEPGQDTAPALSAEQQASLRADLARERALLAKTEAALRDSATALDRALAAARAARAARPGTDAWSNAQMALSRHDLARGPLSDIRARLAPLQRSIDALPPTNPDRQAVEALAAQAAQVADMAQAAIDTATRALAG